MDPIIRKGPTASVIGDIRSDVLIGTTYAAGVQIRKQMVRSVTWIVNLKIIENGKASTSPGCWRSIVGLKHIKRTENAPLLRISTFCYMISADFASRSIRHARSPQVPAFVVVNKRKSER